MTIDEFWGFYIEKLSDQDGVVRTANYIFNTGSVAFVGVVASLLLGQVPASVIEYCRYDEMKAGDAIAM